METILILEDSSCSSNLKAPVYFSAINIVDLSQRHSKKVRSTTTRSSVVSNMPSETKGTWFESAC